jgi:hemerythrin superfamily protein
MKATSLWESQHREIEAIFKELKSGRCDSIQRVVELATHLVGHMTIEQELFYPAVRDIDEELVLEGYEEHALAEVALKRLLVADPEDESFQPRVKATSELIEHHDREEEEELFLKVEEVMEESELVELGARMKARFDDVVAAGFERAISKGLGKSSADASRRSSRRPVKSHAA